jgi:hypothetical protein
MVDLLKSQKPVKWESYSAKEWSNNLYFYLEEMKWVKRFNNTTDQYVALLGTMAWVDQNRYKILDSIIDKAPGLKEYMMIHSVFDIDDNDCTDWFLSYIIDKLNIELSNTKQPIPQDVLEKLSILNLRDVDFLKEDTVLTYGMWKRGPSGRIQDPVNIACWCDLQKNTINMEPVIESYEAIDLSSYDCDVPF